MGIVKWMFRERRKTKPYDVLHNGSTEIRNDYEPYTPEELEFKAVFDDISSTIDLNGRNISLEWQKTKSRDSGEYQRPLLIKNSTLLLLQNLHSQMGMFIEEQIQSQ